MSADNWTKCPNCQKIVDDAIETAAKVRQAKIDAAYGKLPVREFHRVEQEANRIEDVVVSEMTKKYSGENLCEDYEITTSDYGDFTVDYSCSCSVCGFSFKFHHDEVLKLPVKND